MTMSKIAIQLERFVSNGIEIAFKPHPYGCVIACRREVRNNVKTHNRLIPWSELSGMFQSPRLHLELDFMFASLTVDDKTEPPEIARPN